MSPFSGNGLTGKGKAVASSSSSSVTASPSASRSSTPILPASFPKLHSLRPSHGNGVSSTSASITPTTTTGASGASTPASSSKRSSFDQTLDLESEIQQIIDHFSHPDTQIAIDETEASADKGYLGGWAGGFGRGYGKKSKLEEKERFWLSRQRIAKYLDATRGDAQHAITRLTETLVWRRSFQPEKMAQDPDVIEEASRNKHFYCGRTSDGLLLHYVRPTPEESKGGEAQVKHAVWFLEVGEALLDPDVGSTLMLVDMATTRSKKPSLSHTRQALYILQNHYPERLGHAYFRNMNSIASAFFPLTYPFMDTRTSAKLHLGGDPLADGHVTKEELHVDWGGEVKFVPDHPEYFDELNERYRQRNESAFEAWKRTGGRVGYDVKELGDDVVAADDP